ncbi:MAG: ABC transporter permease subunit [Planctomycetes bacterium]|nr:ABC transporter permease subunit [Planctomycetota bacterium]
MPDTLVILRRELKSYFVSPIAYVFGVLLLGVLLFLSSYAIEQGSGANMQLFFGFVPMILVLFVPGLTMRLWAEEQKLGTIQLLMTFPVRTFSLVLGKFLAAVLFLAFVLVLTLGLPLTLGAYGALDWPPVLGAYLATVLFASSFVALGMFWSSTTEDQIVALLLSLVSLGVLYVLGYPIVVDFLTGWLPPWAIDVLSGISPFKYFTSIARGVIDTRDIVYFACFCGFFLYANAMVLNSRRQTG